MIKIMRKLLMFIYYDLLGRFYSFLIDDEENILLSKVSDYLNVDNYNEANVLLEKLKKKYPDSLLVHKNIISLYLMKGLYYDAIIECDKLLKVKPDDMQTREYLAYAYLYKGDYNTVIKESKELLSLHPESILGYWLQGNAYLRQQRYDDAVNGKVKYPVMVKKRFHL